MRRFVVIAAMLASTFALQPPALSDVEINKDARDDVTRFDYNHDAGEISADHPVEKRRSDILRSRVAHTDELVRLRAALDRIVKDNDASIRLILVIRTDRGRRWTAELSYWRNTVVTLTRHFETRAPREVDCPGLRGDTRLKEDVLRISVPRTCLDAPNWVRTDVIAALSIFSEVDRSWADAGRSDAGLKPNNESFDYGARLYVS